MVCDPYLFLTVNQSTGRTWGEVDGSKLRPVRTSAESFVRQDCSWYCVTKPEQ